MNIAMTVMPPLGVISTLSAESIGLSLRGYTAGSAFASAAYPVSNQATYIPFSIPWTISVTKLWAMNGASASNNVDLGIYALDGTRIVSTGSTVRSGTNVPQAIDITDTTIGPGSYYMAIAQNGTTGSYFATASASTFKASVMGVLSQTSAFVLPATATFATVASNFVPLIGMTIAPNTTI